MPWIIVVLAALSGSWQPGAPPPDQEPRIAERLVAEGEPLHEWRSSTSSNVCNRQSSIAERLASRKPRHY